MGRDGRSERRLNLVWPARAHLASYLAALERGWSPDNVRGEAAAREQIERIAADPDRFLASLVDREAKGDPITLKDGTLVPRLPGYIMWMWDGEFGGSIGARWTPGSEALPPHCLGHIGYSVVPWRQRRGYATAALAGMLRAFAAEGLRYAEIVTDPDNMPSRRVIEANGGVLIEAFAKPASLGGTPSLRYRIALDQGGRRGI